MTANAIAARRSPLCPIAVRYRSLSELRTAWSGSTKNQSLGRDVMRILTNVLVRLAIAGAIVVASATGALPQVPPHTAGAICATPAFWCWATIYGPPGSPCVCPTVRGPVVGVYI